MTRLSGCCLFDYGGIDCFYYGARINSCLGACIDTGILVFFFFQAEDGIRDVAVTGVQTCALPI